MNLIERFRVWWQVQTGEEETPFDGDAPAWIVSLVVHLGLILALGLTTLALPTEKVALLLDSSVQEEEELILPEDFFFSEHLEEEIGANSTAGEEMALSLAPIESDDSVVPTEIEEINLASEIKIEPVDDLARGLEKDPNIVVKGAIGQGATGASGAIDRITHEILLSLEQRPTLVVWLFDKSGSLQRQREEIHGRFERIYYELGVIESTGNKAFKKHNDTPLLTAMYAFGAEVQSLISEPTDNIEEIKNALASIENDESGIERVFTAVHQSATRFRQYRVREPRRNVMIVIFTDEAGDDQEGLEPTIALCRRNEMPVYVVGVPAPFGRKEVEIKYVDPDPEFNQEPQWIGIHQGPESMLPERVQLHFTGTGQRDEPIDSGFGPYALTRLCYETGGIYFAVHPNRNSRREVTRRETAELSAHLAHFFDPGIMRNYRPDYVSQREYERLLSENKARAALVQASMLSWASPMENPQSRFPRRDEADLSRILTNAQRDAARVEPRVERLYATLAMGEKDRDRLTQPRWQAGYDLAMGRVLAVMVRAKAYNAMLAQAKQGMQFQDARNDTWILKPSDKVSVGSQLEKQAEQARMYLERVAKDHPGTPWAMLAERELSEPIGWEWTETYTGVNAPRQPQPGNGNPMPRDDTRRTIDKPKPVRTPKL